MITKKSVNYAYLKIIWADDTGIECEQTNEPHQQLTRMIPRSNSENIIITSKYLIDTMYYKFWEEMRVHSQCTHFNTLSECNAESTTQISLTAAAAATAAVVQQQWHEWHFGNHKKQMNNSAYPYQ